MMSAPAPRSAYLHIPFCHRRCFYCDFAVVPLGDRVNALDGPGSRSIALYLDQILLQILITLESTIISTSITTQGYYLGIMLEQKRKQTEVI